MTEAPSERPHLSFSRLNTYNHCGEQFRLSYQEKVPQIPQGPLLAGGAGHETIAQAEGDGVWSWDPDRASEALAGKFRNLLLSKVEEAGGAPAIRWAGRKTKEYPDGEDLRWWLSQGPAMLRRYAATRRADQELGFSVLEGEAEFQILADLPGTGHQVKGYVDIMLLVTPDGERVIRDWKMGKTGGADPLQLATYSWLLELGPRIGVDLGQFCYLRANDPEKRIRSYDLTPLRPLAERLYQDLLRGIDAEVFPLRPSDMCKGCSVRLSCPFGRTLGTEDVPVLSPELLKEAGIDLPEDYVQALRERAS